MAKEKLTAAEWELVKDAPLWVNVVLWAGDKKGMAGTDRRELAALEETLKGYRSTNALIRDILADNSQPSEKLEKASKAEAEVALGRIASIVESKVGADDLDAVNEFLLLVGRNVASAASENALGLGAGLHQDQAQEPRRGVARDAVEGLGGQTQLTRLIERDGLQHPRRWACATVREGVVEPRAGQRGARRGSRHPRR